MNILDMLNNFETFESIRDRMLSRLPDDVDKSQTSFSYNMIAPIAYELYNIHIQLQTAVNSQFVDTAESYYLTQLCKERGVQRLLDRPMIIKAFIYETPTSIATDIPLGTTFRNGTETFTITKGVDVNGLYELTSIGKYPITLTETWQPVTFVSIDRIVVNEIIQNGNYTETDEELRARFKVTTEFYPFGGNIGDYQYKIKTDSPEITQVRVVPRKKEWTDHNIEIYLLKQDRFFNENELPAYVSRWQRFIPIDHKPLFFIPKEDTTTQVKVTVLVPPNTNIQETTEEVKSQIILFCAKVLFKEFDKTETTKLYNSQLIIHLLQTIPYIKNIPVLTFNNDVQITFPYNIAPVFALNNISVTVQEG